MNKIRQKNHETDILSLNNISKCNNYTLFLKYDRGQSVGGNSVI